MPEIFLSDATVELLKPFAEPFETVDIVVARLASLAKTDSTESADSATASKIHDFSLDDPPSFTFATITRLRINNVESRPNWITLSDAAILAVFNSGGLQAVHRMISPKIFHGKAINGCHHIDAINLHYHGFLRNEAGTSPCVLLANRVL
jgi:hypothetical protein